MPSDAARERNNEAGRRQRQRDREQRALEEAEWRKTQAELRRGFPKRVRCLKCSREMTSPSPSVRLCNICREWQSAQALGGDPRLLEGPAWGEP
jgi:hypothetical protein